MQPSVRRHLRARNIFVPPVRYPLVSWDGVDVQPLLPHGMTKRLQASVHL